MGARSKLNVAYVNGSLIVAVIVGLLSQSFGMFVLVAAILLIGSLVTGEIRPRRRLK